MNRIPEMAEEDGPPEEDGYEPSTVETNEYVTDAAASTSRSIFSRKKKPARPAKEAQLGSRRSSFIGIAKRPRLGIFKKRQTSLASTVSLATDASDVPPAAQPANLRRESTLAAPVSRGKSFEGNVSEHLAAFEGGTFDLGEEISGLDQKGIVELREQLMTTKRECNEKIKRLLHQHYPAFISASKGIRAMDGEMQSLRALLNRENSLLNTVKEIADPQGRFKDRAQQAEASETWTRSWADSPEGLRWNESLLKLDMAIAERRPADALPLLKQAEKRLLPGQKSGLYAHSLQADPDLKNDKQARELALRRSRLAALVTAQVADLPLGSTQMQVATQVLASLSGRAHSLRKHLDARTVQLRRAVDQLLKPQNSGGGDADGTEFCNALSQVVFGAIGAAAEDAVYIFGKELRELASVILVWALSETEACALILKRNAISPFAAPAGLGPTVYCCVLALCHCAALQAACGLRLSPRLMRDLWPSCEQVLQRRVKRIIEDVKAAVVLEVDTLAERGLPQPSTGGAWSDLMQIFPSADLVLDELEAIVTVLKPLSGPRVREALSHALLRLFVEYTNAITAQFSRYRDTEGILPKALDDAVEAALEVAHSMVEQFLPELGEPLRLRCGEICKLKALYAQLNTFQDRLLPEEEEPEESIHSSNGGGESSESEAENGTAHSEAGSSKDWRKYQTSQQLADEEVGTHELGEEEFILGRKSSRPLDEPIHLGPTRSFARMGQIMGEEEGLQSIARISAAAKQEVGRGKLLKQIPTEVLLNGGVKAVALPPKQESVDEIEE